MIRLKYILLLLFTLVIASCVDKIDFDVPGGLSESIAINGRLVKDGDDAIINVTVSNVFDFDLNGRRPVTVRDPKLYDEAGNSVTLERVALSDYQRVIPASDPFKVEYGKSYSLEVSLFDGRMYRSTFEVLLPSPEVDSFTFEIIDQPILNSQGDLVIDQRLALNVSTSLEVAGVRPGLLWDLERVWKMTDFAVPAQECYIPENPNRSRALIVEGDDFESDRIDNYKVIDIPLDRRISEGMLLNIKQYSLSTSAARFWRSADLLLTKTGNMFDAPSSRIESNFFNVADSTDQAYGFFFVTEVKEGFVKIDEEDFPGLGTFCETADSENPCPFGCCDCTEIPDVFLTPPANWDK